MASSNFVKVSGFGQRLRTIVRLSLLSWLLSSCLPKEVSLPLINDSTSSPSVTGFNGATAVQTIGATKVKVTWTKISDSSVVAYNIYDSTFLFSPTLVKTVPASASEATITGLETGKYYTFRVRAANSSNQEDDNMIDLGGIPYGGVKSSVVQNSTSASLDFNDGSIADQVNIYCKTATTTYTQMATITNVALSSTVLTGLTSGTEYTCRAALQVDGFVDNNTVTTTFTPMGQATELVFSTQPGSAVAGAELAPQPVVTIKDANGNTVTAGPDSKAVITLNVATDSPTLGTIRGTASVTAVKGVATFTGLSLQEAGVKTLTASKPDTTNQTFGTLPMTVTSSQFTISAGPVSPMTSTISISPAVPPNPALIANGNDSYTVTIVLKDQYGNPVSGTKPTFASSIPGDTLSQPAQATDALGTITGAITSTISDATPPYRMISISSPAGLSSVAVAAPFVPGPATKLAFLSQPVNSPAGILGMNVIKVVIQDAQGNTVATGPSATASITLSIANNVGAALLTGTVTADAVAGVATFSDLGIDKTGTGYKLIASTASFNPAYSNSFNITPGVPRKISVAGPAKVVSGTCSSAITIQLQDYGNNSANAQANASLQISGLGSAALYTSSSCSGTALTSTLTITAGQSTKTVYVKDLKAEAISVTVADTGSVLQTGSLPVVISPSKIGLIAQAPPPMAPGNPLLVPAGRCSSGITITPAGENGQPGPIFSVTNVNITGLSGTPAKIYSDAACTMELPSGVVPLPITVGINYSTTVYLKDDKSEELNILVVDPAGIMATATVLQTVKVGPSVLDFKGPSSVVAGKCSTAYTLTLKDTAGNSVAAADNTTLELNGLSGSANGKFYMTPGCTGSATNSSITVPAGSPMLQIYFKDIAAETLMVSVRDPLLNMSTSQTVSIAVSPSALSITAPSNADKTSVCAGPFTINTLDGVGSVTAAIDTINVNLTGAGAAGKFFLDSSCATQVTSAFVFAAGQSEKQFWFKGLYPDSLTFQAADAASVLTSGTVAFAVQAAKGWIGTSGTMFDSTGELFWFQMGEVPVSARTNGPASSHSISFSPDKRYMYVVDRWAHRILKYDYVNKKYIGWLGMFTNPGGIGVSGSNLTSPSDAACVGTVNGTTTPGWCVGGFSAANGQSTTGGLYDPWDLVDDGNYIYVSNYSTHIITRYESETGKFAGWIGRLATVKPTADGPGSPGGCTTMSNYSWTPGWCMGGSHSAGDYFNVSGFSAINGLRYAYSLVADENYLYVGSEGYITRHSLQDGSYQGWIGMVGTVAPTGGSNPSCTSTAANNRTPGWCMGGSYIPINPTSNGGGGISNPYGMTVVNGTLYVLMRENGVTISTYDLASGSYLGRLPTVGSMVSPNKLTSDGDNLYVADWTRVLRVGLTTDTGLVTGWIGKVNNNNSMSGNVGCDTLVPNANTPGWCLGGSAKPGMDPASFSELTAIGIDGSGNLITGQGRNNPAIKRWDITTGNYTGTLAVQSTSPREWSNDALSFSQFKGFDDYSMWSPYGIFSDGASLYMTEDGASRVKKIDLKTGNTLGWIGAITAAPTGGAAGCTGGNAMGPSPGWCLGGLFQPNYMWNTGMVAPATNGIFYSPWSVVGDGTFLYVLDRNLHRISKFNLATGAFVGWIGRISTSPTGPSGTTCVNAPVGSFTPGWCTGGYPQAGSGDGHLSSPSSITYAGGNLYVVDANNHRVSSYNASTGAFNGWIGRIGTNPSSGCSPASNGSYNVSNSGWCLGGTATNSPHGGDRGGGFYFWSAASGITTDGTFLYIANFYNYRIDRFNMNGQFVATTSSRGDIYTGSWSSDPAVFVTYGAPGCSYPMAIWTDGTNMYGTSHHGCSGSSAGVVWKMNLSEGRMLGWQGAINPGSPPSGGDTNCAGAALTTPGWCQGGGGTSGYRMGQFSVNAYGITGDAHFVYVTDADTQRVTRLPK